MSTVDENTRLQQRNYAATFLQEAAAHLEQSRLNRLRWISLARTYGLTWAEIGQHLGISDVAARRLHQRNPEVE